MSIYMFSWKNKKKYQYFLFWLKRKTSYPEPLTIHKCRPVHFALKPGHVKYELRLHNVMGPGMKNTLFAVASP